MTPRTNAVRLSSLVVPVVFALLLLAACSSETVPAAAVTPVATDTPTTGGTQPTSPATAEATQPPASPTPATAPEQTPAALPKPDPRYGLIVTSDVARAYEVFGAGEYIDYSLDSSHIPEGTRKVFHIRSVNPVPVDQIRAAAKAAPGSVWYVLGEPNAQGQAVMDVLIGLYDTYDAIKSVDPTALITSPSILNYSFNCINCGGYPYGATWISDFYFEYIDLFGEDPPIDIWAIDVFPIVWPGGSLSSDEAFPTVRDDLVVKQVTEFREWLNAREATRDAPIWITELGLHWGFTDWKFGVEGCDGAPSPAGEYQADEVRKYLKRVYTWLEDNSEALNIERWFTFSTYRDVERCHGDSGNGLTMLDSQGETGQLTEIGTFYNHWTRGIR